MQDAFGARGKYSVEKHRPKGKQDTTNRLVLRDFGRACLVEVRNLQPWQHSAFGYVEEMRGINTARLPPPSFGRRSAKVISRHAIGAIHNALELDDADAVAAAGLPDRRPIRVVGLIHHRLVGRTAHHHGRSVADAFLPEGEKIGISR